MPHIHDPSATHVDEAAALRAELDAARGELAAIRSGVAWKALTAYRRLARKVAPEGSRLGQAYDRLLGSVRPPAAAQPTPAAVAEDVSGPPGANTWFRDHYDEAATKVVEFLALDGISLESKEVADIGAGDGIIDLGLVHKGRPSRLVAFDVNAVDPGDLLAAAMAEGVCDALPPALEFSVAGPTSLPAEDASFDVVVTWSAFERSADPLGVLREARRILRDDGCLFLQVWPFYHSQFGSHLRDWFPEGWEQLQRPGEEIEALVRASDLHGPEWVDVMLGEFAELNKVTVDDLGVALAEAGFDVRRLNLLSRSVPVPSMVASRHPLSVLGIEGVELLAVPLPR